MFTLDKWYLDLVTDEGTAIVAYSARLAWGRARVGYASTLVSRPNAPAEEHSVYGHVAAPACEGDRITWSHPALRLRGAWHALAAPIDARLLDHADGRIDWHCAMPRSRVTIDLDDVRHSGLGYVEQLTLTIPPWKLPFDRLRWGRYTSESQALVWIAWSGADARQFVWHDGVPQPDAIIDDRGVRGLQGGAELHFGEARDVCARPALARLVDRLPSPVQSLAAPVAAMFEHKMLAPGQVVLAGTPLNSGWSLYEEVRW